VRETGQLPGSAQGCHDREQHVIWLSDSLTAAERRSTLAHQVGHLELGPFDPDRGGGGMVDNWAYRLLIPFDDRRRCCDRYDELADVAAELWVDWPMLRARLRGLMDGEQALLDVARWRELIQRGVNQLSRADP
jgi:hypothetical protein